MLLVTLNFLVTSVLLYESVKLINIEVLRFSASFVVSLNKLVVDRNSLNSGTINGLKFFPLNNRFTNFVDLKGIQISVQTDCASFPEVFSGAKKPNRSYLGVLTFL